MSPIGALISAMVAIMRIIPPTNVLWCVLRITLRTKVRSLAINVCINAIKLEAILLGTAQFGSAWLFAVLELAMLIQWPNLAPTTALLLSISTIQSPPNSPVFPAAQALTSPTTTPTLESAYLPAPTTLLSSET